MPRTAVVTERPNSVLVQVNLRARRPDLRADERRKRDDRHDDDVELDHWITEPSLKIGRYMATTRPPITTPRNRMTIGSINDMRFATVWSTSES